MSSSSSTTWPMVGVWERLVASTKTFSSSSFGETESGFSVFNFVAVSFGSEMASTMFEEID